MCNCLRDHVGVLEICQIGYILYNCIYTYVCVLAGESKPHKSHKSHKEKKHKEHKEHKHKKDKKVRSLYSSIADIGRLFKMN